MPVMIKTNEATAHINQIKEYKKPPNQMKKKVPNRIKRQMHQKNNNTPPLMI